MARMLLGEGVSGSKILEISHISETFHASLFDSALMRVLNTSVAPPARPLLFQATPTIKIQPFRLQNNVTHASTRLCPFANFLRNVNAAALFQSFVTAILPLVYRGKNP